MENQVYKTKQDLQYTQLNSGILSCQYCDCDITITKYGKLVLKSPSVILLIYTLGGICLNWKLYFTIQDMMSNLIGCRLTKDSFLTPQKDILVYRKIPNVSPGLIEVFKHFLGGLYSGGLIFEGAYIRRAFCVSVRVSRP